MDPAIKGGFLVGFAVLAVAALFGWSQGWIAPGGEKPTETSRLASPGAQGVAPGASGKAAPGGTQAPNATPAPGDKSAAGQAPEAGGPPAAGGAQAPGAVTPPGAATPRAGDQAAAASPSQGSTAPAGAQGAPGQAAAPSAPGDMAALTPPSATPKPSDAAPVEKGVFDVVRVEPSGELVAAGRCPDGCTVELTANGRTIETAKADATGAFVLTPPSLPAGDHQLGLKVTGPDGKQAISEQTVTVSVPAAPSKDVVVVLNAPDAPSKILQQPGQAPSAAKPVAGAATTGRTPGAGAPSQAVASLSLGAVDAENGRFFVQGTAPAGARLRVYLNNALVAEPVAGADGRWSLKVEKGLTPGQYVARVDQIGPNGKVATRAEQGFAYEADVAVAGQGGSGQAGAPSEKGASAPSSAPNAAGSGQPKTSAGAPASGQPSSQGGGSVASNAAPTAPSAAGDAPKGAAGASASPPAAAPSAEAAGAQAAAGSAAQQSGSSTGAGQDAAQAASGPTPDQSAAAPSAGEESAAANPVVKSIDTAKVKRGDSLWRISRTIYGRGQRYTMIFSANDSQIRNPDLIYPGQVLVLPPAQAGAAAETRPGG